MHSPRVSVCLNFLELCSFTASQSDEEFPKWKDRPFFEFAPPRPFYRPLTACLLGVTGRERIEIPCLTAFPSNSQKSGKIEPRPCSKTYSPWYWLAGHPPTEWSDCTPQNHSPPHCIIFQFLSFFVTLCRWPAD